jgi:hypothetical protein
MTTAPSLNSSSDLQGPLDVASFPETLSARVVTPGPQPRLHGYDVEADLAVHYGPTDLLALALTGELPSPEASAALAVALSFLAPVSVAHASVHAATIAGLCGSTTGSTIGVAAIGLAEQARVLLDEHRELLAWLAAPNEPLPARYQAIDPDDRAGTARLRAAIAETCCEVPALSEWPTRNAALISVLFTCGLKERSHLEAEAIRVKVADFNLYATNLPRYQYQDLP